MTEEELRNLARNLTLVGPELALFDLSPNCTNNCSSNGVCLENSLGCECFAGYHLRDCSLNSSEYEKFLGLKKRVYQLSTQLSEVISDQVIQK